MSIHELNNNISNDENFNSSFSNDEFQNYNEIFNQEKFFNQNDLSSEDFSTGITHEEQNENLGKKTNRFEDEINISNSKEFKKVIQNQMNEEIKNKDFFPKIFKKVFDYEQINKNTNERYMISLQEQDEIYKKDKQKKIGKFNLNVASDLISQNCCNNVRFDGIVKKVKKLFFHHILKKSNEILKKKGILKKQKFRIPSHDFTKNVTIESNKFILTIDFKSLFCSTFEKKCHIGDVLKKKIEDNKSIFENYSFLENEYNNFFCVPLEKLLSDYLNSPEFLEDVKTLNMKCKKNPIQLDRILGDGENNLINYFKLNQRYGKK